MAKKTRDIENKLSDHLHVSLTNRFVDLSASYFVDALLRGDEPKIEVDSNKSIKLNGQNYGYINGFDLKLNDNTDSNSLFSLFYVKKSIRLMIEEKISNFLNAPNNSINLGDVQKFKLNETVNIYWGENLLDNLLRE